MSQEAREYEAKLYEWALHQKPVPLRGAIIGMEAGETGITLTVVVDYPALPKGPEALDQQPEAVKEELHRALEAHWRTEASISALRISPITLHHPAGINPFLRELADEGANWAAHQEKLKGKAPVPQG